MVPTQMLAREEILQTIVSSKMGWLNIQNKCQIQVTDKSEWLSDAVTDFYVKVLLHLVIAKINTA